jgi:hypothetical protein
MDEIVGVKVTGAGDGAFARCVSEAVWEVELDDRFDRRHVTTDVRIE